MAETFRPTLTVKRSRSAIRADGRAGLMLETLEEGSFVLELNLHTVAALRLHLDEIESHLKSRIRYV